MPQSVNITGNLQMNTASIQQSARQIQQALGRITGQASEFQKSLDASTARVFAFGATTTVLQAVNQSFKKLIDTTIEVEKRLIEINSIFQATDAQFNKFRNSIFQVAKNTGQAFSVVADGAAELARQGLSAEETAKRLNAALILSRISGMDAEKSVKSLTAAINGFTSAGLSAEQIVNKIVAVDTAFAVSAQDLADGFARAGSTAEDAGVSFDELLGLITAVEQRTARGGAVIGNAFKSIFTRLSRGSTIDDLQALGVQIDATQTGIQKLQALSAALENISDPTVANQIKELAGGVFQINVVSSTLKDLSSDTSIFAGAAKEAAQATNEAFSKNEMLNTSLAAQINSLIASVTSFGERIGQLTISPLLGNLVKIATSISEALDKALDPEKGNVFIQGLFKAIGSFISGPGLVLITTAFLKITMLVAKFAKEGFQAVLQIGNAQQKNAAIQEGVIGLLQRDAQLRKILSSQTATQAQKEQAVIDAIRRENQLLADQQRIVQNIVALVARKGVAGFTPTGGFQAKKGKSFAAGFQAEEATAMMLGATPDVKAHYGKGKIGGRKFIMNNQEVEIPNFGANGDSAVIPMYARGYAAGKGALTGMSLAELRRKSSLKSFNPKSGTDKNIAADLAALEARGQGQQPTISSGVLKKYAYLVPQIGASGMTQPRVIDGVKYEGGSPIHGLQKNQIRTVSDREEDGLSSRMQRDVFRNTQTWVNKLKPLGRSISSSEVKSGFENTKGAKGALGAAVGAAFEVGITQALDQKAAVAKRGMGDFDVRNPNENLKKLFGFSQNKGDFKNRYASDNEKSFYKKIAKEEKFLASPKKRGRRKAAGHFPKAARSSTKINIGGARMFAVGNTGGGSTGASDGSIGKILALQTALSAVSTVTNSLVGKKSQEVQSIESSIQAKQEELQKSQEVAEEKKREIQSSIQASEKKMEEIALSDKSFEQKAVEISAIEDGLRAKKQEIQTIQDSILKQKESSDSYIKSKNTQLEVAKAAEESAQKYGEATNSLITAIATIQTLNLATQGGLGKAAKKAGSLTKGVSGLTAATALTFGKSALTKLSAAVVAGAKAAVPILATAGPLLALAAIPLIANAIKNSVIENRNKQINNKIKGDDFAFLMKRRAQMTDRAGGGGGKGAAKISNTIKTLGESVFDGAIDLGKEIEDLRNNMSKLKGQELFNNMIKLQEKMKEAEVHIANNFEFFDLGIEIKALKGAVAGSAANMMMFREQSLASSQAAADMVSMISQIHIPEGVGEFFGRAQAGEMAIAETGVARDEKRLIESQLSEAIRTNAGEDKIKELEKSLAEAGKTLESKVKSAAVTLSNTIKQNEAQLKSLQKTLAEQQRQQVGDRFALAGNLSSKEIDVAGIRSDFEALKTAKTPEERANLMARINDTREGLNAISPNMFESLAKTAGLDLNKLTKGSEAAALKEKGFSAEEIKGIMEERKAAGPDIEKTEKEINQLNDATKLAQERLTAFGEAFAGDNAKGVIKQIKVMEESLSAVAEGTKSASSVIQELNKVNDNAIKLAEESDKKVASIIEKIAGWEKIIQSMQQRQDQIMSEIKGS